ncbi:MAG: cation:dicarboxylase symporter family transporter, partial [Candidatus Nealsonbacteria bacterium]|nr:cation:dicarboxylase symporter family transporter [Candidatus Nealsonbacteria bacterium]
MNTIEQQPKRRGHGFGLLAILVGIVLGIAFGLLYGRTMWLASDGVRKSGAEKEVLKLELTLDQKEDFAKKADEQAEIAREKNDVKEAERLEKEGQRLRSHVPEIRKEIVRIEKLQALAKQGNQAVPANVYRIVKFCGDLFLRMLFVIVIPLVVTSMICGITSLGDVRRLGKVGGWTLAYYMATGAVAVSVGILLVVLIAPGERSEGNDTFAYTTENVLSKQQIGAVDTLMEVVLGREGEKGKGMVPSNIFLAASETNVLALILAALVFGGTLSTLGERGKPAIDFFHSANEAVMKIVHLIIMLAPVGIFGLIATKITDSGGGEGFGEELARLVWFVVTVLLGLAIHVVVLSLILLVFARRNPLRYLYTTARALLTAMSTASSSATLPVTMQCVEDDGVSKRAAGFVLPLGATINMDGTALYEATAAIFIAQSMGVELSFAALVIVFLTATLAAIGAPGIPEAGLVTLVIVLTAVGLPIAGIGTLLAIDWFLDRQRTTVNVFGDAVGAAVIDRYLRRGS